MRKSALAILLALSLPAWADGFFPRPAEQASPEVLRVPRQCTFGQVMTCTLRCPAPADGRMPAAAVCQVVTCSCADAVAPNSGGVPMSSAVVTFNLRQLLGLPVPK